MLDWEVLLFWGSTTILVSSLCLSSFYLCYPMFLYGSFFLVFLSFIGIFLFFLKILQLSLFLHNIHPPFLSIVPCRFMHVSFLYSFFHSFFSTTFVSSSLIYFDWYPLEQLALLTLYLVNTRSTLICAWILFEESWSSLSQLPDII